MIGVHARRGARLRCNFDNGTEDLPWSRHLIAMDIIWPVVRHAAGVHVLALAYIARAMVRNRNPRPSDAYSMSAACHVQTSNTPICICISRLDSCHDRNSGISHSF